MKRGVIWVVLLLFLIGLPISYAYIHSANITGRHGIQNVVDTDNSKDDLLFNVFIVDPDTELEDVSIIFPSFNSEFLFSSCPGADCNPVTDVQYPSDTFLCSCQTDWAPSEKTDIIINHDGSALSETICPDKLPPEIDYTLEQEDGKLKIEYSISDQSNDDCPSKCAGVKYIKIYDSNGDIFSKEYDTYDCLVEDEAVVSYGKDGMQTIFIEAADMMYESRDDKHYNIEKYDFDGDFTSPKISGFDLKRYNHSIEYFSVPLDDVELSFKLKEKNPKSLSVMLSSLGDNPDIYDADPMDYCTTANGEDWLCLFTISLDTQDVSVDVTAKDQYNSKTETFTKSLKTDDEAPEIISAGSRYEKDGELYIGKEDTDIILEIKESESGFYGANVMLDLSSLGYSNFVKADECIKNTNWKCYWYNITRISGSSSKHYFSVYYASADDAGNKVTSNGIYPIIYDNTLPSDPAVEVYSVTGLGEVMFHQSGDILKVYANVTDDNGISKALLNASELFNSDVVIEGSCDPVENETDIYRCSWETDPIKSGFYEAELEFHVEDVAGNSVDFDHEITVYGILDETPDFYNIKIGETVPKAVNRLTASILPNPPGYKIYVPFVIYTSSTRTEVLYYQIYDCEAEDSTVGFEKFFVDRNNPTEIPLKTLYSVTQSGETNYFELILKQLDENESSAIQDIDIECVMDINIRRGDRIFSEPEKENISFTLKFSDATITGVPGEKIIDKINDQKDDLMYKMKWISSAMKVIKSMEKMCNIGRQIVSFWGSLAMIEGVGSAMEKTGIPGVVQAGKAIYSVGCYSYEIIGGNVVMPIWYGKGFSDNGFSVQNCDGRIGIGDRPEITKSMNSISYYVGDNVKILKDDQWPGLRWICGFVSCEYGTKFSENWQKMTGGAIFESSSSEEIQQQMQNEEQDSVDPKQRIVGDKYLNFGSLGYVDMSSKAIRLDPQDSLLMSAATMCIPGVFYNLDKWRQIKCGYIKCLEEAAASGGDVSVCDKTKKEGTCLVIFGEVARSIGIVNLIDSVSQQLVQVASDLLPNALKAVFDKALCHNKAEQDSFLYTVACDIPRYWYTFKDSVDRMKSLASVANKDTWAMGSDYKDVCADVQ